MGCRGTESQWHAVAESAAHTSFGCGICCTHIMWQLPTHTSAEDVALHSMVRLATRRASIMLSFLRSFCSTLQMCECGTVVVITYSSLTTFAQTSFGSCLHIVQQRMWRYIPRSAWPTLAHRLCCRSSAAHIIRCASVVP